MFTRGRTASNWFSHIKQISKSFGLLWLLNRIDSIGIPFHLDWFIFDWIRTLANDRLSVSFSYESTYFRSPSLCFLFQRKELLCFQFCAIFNRSPVALSFSLSSTLSATSCSVFIFLFRFLLFADDQIRSHSHYGIVGRTKRERLSKLSRLFRFIPSESNGDCVNDRFVCRSDSVSTFSNVELFERTHFHSLDGGQPSWSAQEGHCGHFSCIQHQEHRSTKSFSHESSRVRGRSKFSASQLRSRFCRLSCPPYIVHLLTFGELWLGHFRFRSVRRSAICYHFRSFLSFDKAIACDLSVRAGHTIGPTWQASKTKDNGTQQNLVRDPNCVVFTVVRFVSFFHDCSNRGHLSFVVHLPLHRQSSASCHSFDHHQLGQYPNCNLGHFALLSFTISLLLLLLLSLHIFSLVKYEQAFEYCFSFFLPVIQLYHGCRNHCPIETILVRILDQTSLSFKLTQIPNSFIYILVFRILFERLLLLASSCDALALTRNAKQKHPFFKWKPPNMPSFSFLFSFLFLLFCWRNLLILL